MRKILLSYFLIFTTIVFTQQTVIDFNQSGLFNTCNGFIIDSGGQGGGGYSNDEDYTITICPDNPDDIINVVFNTFNLDVTDDNPLPNVSNVDQMYVYDGNSTAGNFLGSYGGTDLQGVIIQCSPQNTSGCLTFTFTSNSVNANTGTFSFSGSASCVTPCNDPFAQGGVLNGITQDSIHACIGQELFFEDLGSFAQAGFTLAEYKWDFMDGSIELGQQVSHTYSQPGHYRVQLFVTDNNGCDNNNLIDVDVLVATPPNFSSFMNDTVLCIGESLQLVAEPLFYENTWSGFSGETTIDNGCLPDTLLGIAQEIDVIQTGFQSGVVIENANQIVSLCLELEHSYMGDIVVSVTCPNGQSAILHQQGGGGTQIGEPNPADNIDCSDPSTIGVPYEYCFDSQATQTWVEYANQTGGTLPAGTYEPIQPLSNLVGCPANGVWTLTVVDNWAADDGMLQSFTINLDTNLYAEIIEFTPQHNANLDSSYWTFPAQFASGISADGDRMTITPTQAGTFHYFYSVINDFGCQNDTSVTVNVFDFNLPASPVDTTICAGNLYRMLQNGDNCSEYTLRLEDSFGDGWNGNNLNVSINGVTSTYTIDDGDLAEFQIPVNLGDQIILVFDNSGSFVSECSYQIIDCNGQVVRDQNSPLNIQPIEMYIGPFTYPVEYTWSPANIFGNQVNNINPEILIANNINVSLFAAPVGHPSCGETANATISVINGTYVGLDSTVNICQTIQPENLLVYLGPGANTTGTWLSPSGASVVMPIVTNALENGEYVYTVNTNGCEGTARVTVSTNIPSIDNINVNDVTCVTTTNGSVDLSTSNANFYRIGNGAFQSISGNNFSIPNLGFGEYVITVRGSDPSCIVLDTIFVNQPDSLEIININDTITICNGASANLFAQGQGGSSQLNYSWSLNGTPIGNQSSMTVTPLLPLNNYCVTLTEACQSMQVSECTVVKFEDNIVPSIQTQPLICIGDSSLFLNTTNSNNILTSIYYFDNGDSLIVMGKDSFNYVFNELGVYDLAITTISQLGCIYNASYQNVINVKQKPTANFYLDEYYILVNDPIVGASSTSTSDVVEHLWITDGAYADSLTSPNITINYQIDTAATYDVKLIVTNFVGCKDSVVKQVVVNDMVNIFIPNSFTPNGDELNNTLRIETFGIDLQDFEMKIFNKWGQLIFLTRDPSVGWDGTFGSGLVQDGTYTIYLEATNAITKEKIVKSGFVNVMK